MTIGQRSGFVLLAGFFFMSTVLAQQGTAPRGVYRYPANYHGDTFTGEFLRSDDKHLILQYKASSGLEIFTGKIDAPCMAPLKADPHQTRELHLSTVPNGTVVTAFYNPGKSPTGAKENVVLAIRFDRWNGREFTNPKRPLIPCSADKKQDNNN